MSSPPPGNLILVVSGFDGSPKGQTNDKSPLETPNSTLDSSFTGATVPSWTPVLTSLFSTAGVETFSYTFLLFPPISNAIKNDLLIIF